MSDQWRCIEECLAANSRRWMRGRDREDVCAEARFQILRAVARGMMLRNPAAFAAVVLRAVCARSLRDRYVLLGDSDVHLVDLRRECCVATVVLDAPSARIDRLRGGRRRQLAAMVVAGSSCSAIADQLRWPLKEVRRRILRLAEVVARSG